MSRILLLNKPYNVLCQFTDNEGRATLADYLNEKGLYPAGRLDRDSEGLLLLTDDGQLQHCITHPSAKLEKSYWVQVEGAVNESALQQLRDGVILKDGPARATRVAHLPSPAIWPRNPPIRYRATIPDSWLTLTISEGRNRQVRRMTAAIGFPTLRLIRWSIGGWELGTLAPGQWRELDSDEVADFRRRCMQLKSSRDTHSHPRRVSTARQRTRRHKRTEQ